MELLGATDPKKFPPTQGSTPRTLAGALKKVGEWSGSPETVSFVVQSFVGGQNIAPLWGKSLKACGTGKAHRAQWVKTHCSSGEGQKKPITYKWETGIYSGATATGESRAGSLIMSYLWDSGKPTLCLPPVRVTQDPENIGLTSCPTLSS